MFFLGDIVGTHGLKGELKLRSQYAEFVFLAGQKLRINGQDFIVEAARPHKNNILLKLQGLDDLTAAEKLRGQRAELAKRPDDNSVFYEDILQKEAIDQNGKSLGTVTDILQTPAHEVLVISAALSVKEILVPYIDKFVLEISDKIKVDLSNLSE